MGRKATVAQDTVWYKARVRAAEWNDRLNGREGAAQVLGIDQSRLSKIERDLVNPYPEEVKMMIEDYHAPELANYFCREKCPLGRDFPKVEVADLDRITVRALAVFQNLDKTKQELLAVAADGTISVSERAQMESILCELQKLEEVAQSLRLWVKKNIMEE